MSKLPILERFLSVGNVNPKLKPFFKSKLKPKLFLLNLPPALRQPHQPRRRLAQVSHLALLRRPRILHHRGAQQPREGPDQARRHQHLALAHVPVQLLRRSLQEVQHRPDGHPAVRGEPAEEQEEPGPAYLEGDGAQDGRHRGGRGDDQRADRRHGGRGPPQAGGRLLQPDQEHAQELSAAEGLPGAQFNRILKYLFF